MGRMARRRGWWAEKVGPPCARERGWGEGRTRKGGLAKAGAPASLPMLVFACVPGICAGSSAPLGHLSCDLMSQFAPFARIYTYVFPLLVLPTFVDSCFSLLLCSLLPLQTEVLASRERCLTLSPRVCFRCQCRDLRIPGELRVTEKLGWLLPLHSDLASITPHTFEEERCLDLAD